MKKLYLVLFVCCYSLSAGADVVLPVGSAPVPVAVYHFPSRLHTFVWRNWSLVSVERLAQVLQTEPEQVAALAESMGLPPQSSFPDIERIYITLLRRNWHLLPYEQILILIDATPEKLLHSLKEDDFLFIKLGSLKPHCEPLLYHEPTETEKERCAEIRDLSQRELVQAGTQPAEDRFYFLKRFQKSPSETVESIPLMEKHFSPRFIYSYAALYGDPLLDPELGSYPEGLLQQLSALGIDGIWIHTVLRQLAPSDLFPEFGEGSQTRLKNLNILVQRAKQYGVGVYLYMNEPRAMPESFFANRDKYKGVQQGDYFALCTSAPEVRQWLTDSLAHVFEQVPDLAGVFTITASENFTHCASHGKSTSCPRCGKRTIPVIIAEVNAAIAEGVHRGNPEAKVIAWDWGWSDAWAEETIRRLPKSVWLQSVSEWSKPISRGGVETQVGEYSLSAVGPGPRAVKHWQIAKEVGLKTLAKVQMNATWELSALPYLPVFDLIAEHCANLLNQKVDGLMLSWTVGGYPSPNLELVQRFEKSPPPTAEEALNELAANLFGEEGTPYARRAWTRFSRAFEEYPYHGSVVYQCPVQLGPANLFYPMPSGYKSTMVGFPYDDVDGWRGPYPVDVFAKQFETMAEMWEKGMPELETAVAKASPLRQEEVNAQLRFAEAARLHFSSVANQVRFTLLRNQVIHSSATTTKEELENLLKNMREILSDEIEISRGLFSRSRQDSRIGFEASNQYYYVPDDLLEKIINCQFILDNLVELYPPSSY